MRRGHSGARCSARWGEVEGAGSRAGGAGVEDEFAGGSAGPIKGRAVILGRLTQGRSCAGITAGDFGSALLHGEDGPVRRAAHVSEQWGETRACRLCGERRWRVTGRRDLGCAREAAERVWRKRAGWGNRLGWRSGLRAQGVA